MTALSFRLGVFPCLLVAPISSIVAFSAIFAGLHCEAQLIPGTSTIPSTVSVLNSDEVTSANAACLYPTQRSYDFIAY
jgi:hypothetical protein